MYRYMCIYIYIHIHIPVNPLTGVETNVLIVNWLAGWVGKWQSGLLINCSTSSLGNW